LSDRAKGAELLNRSVVAKVRDAAAIDKGSYLLQLGSLPRELQTVRPQVALAHFTSGTSCHRPCTLRPRMHSSVSVTSSSISNGIT